MTANDSRTPQLNAPPAPETELVGSLPTDGAAGREEGVRGRKGGKTANVESKPAKGCPDATMSGRNLLSGAARRGV